MKNLLFFLLFSIVMFPQLKEFEIKEAKAPPNQPVFVENPDDAAVIIYSSISNLSFESNTAGIVKQKSEENKYILVLKTEKQYITVKSRGYLERSIKIPKLDARSVLYFQIETKGGDELLIPVNIVTSPTGAQIYLDGEFKGTTPGQQLKEGVHKLRLVLQGYKTLETNIQVSTAKTLFNFTLQPLEQGGVEIRTTPEQAEIFIDGASKGESNRSFFLFPGTYQLRLVKSGYRDVAREITVHEDTIERFEFALVKNTGIVNIQVTPARAQLKINGQIYPPGEIELLPATYIVEVSYSGYLPVKDTITLALGVKIDKTYSLEKNTGIVSIQVTPAHAQLKINGQIYPPGEIELLPATYIVEVSYSGYLPVKDTITLALGVKIDKTYSLEKNAGYLALTVTPSDAEITINREKVSYKQGTPIELGPGQYKIEITKEGYYGQNEIFEVELNKTISRAYTLKQMTGSLQFSVQPLDAEVKLLQNGVLKYGWVGLRVQKDIPVGNYQLTCSYAGYEPLTKNITITENKTTVEDIALKSTSQPVVQKEKKNYPEPAITNPAVSSGGGPKYLSFLLPGLGQAINGKWTGYVFLAATAGIGAYCYTQVNEYNSNVKEYNTAVQIYNAAPSETTKQDVLNIKSKIDNIYSTYTMTLGVAAGMYVLNLLDVYLLTEVNSNLRIKPGFDTKYSPRIQVTYNF